MECLYVMLNVIKNALLKGCANAVMRKRGKRGELFALSENTWIYTKCHRPAIFYTNLIIVVATIASNHGNDNYGKIGNK